MSDLSNEIMWCEGTATALFVLALKIRSVPDCEAIVDYPVRQSFTVDIERHRKLEFRAGVLQHSGIILDQHIL